MGQINRCVSQGDPATMGRNFRAPGARLCMYDFLEIF